MSDTLDSAVWALRNTQVKLSIPKPSSMLRGLIVGDLPTDRSDARTPTGVQFVLLDSDAVVLEAAADLSIQGQSSAADPKPNYKLKLTNRYSGQKLSVKLGDMLPVTKFTLKGYGDGPYHTNYGNGDRSFVRDQVAAALWRKIRASHAWPDNLIAPLAALTKFEASNNGFPSNALYSTAGYPLALYHETRGFIGLYMLRSDNDAPEYAMDDGDFSNVLIQPQHMSSDGWFKFDSTQWVVTSPKLKKYNDQDDISKKYPDLCTAINRWCTWFGGIRAGSVHARETHYDYIDLAAWIDNIVFNEVSGNNDSMTNNVMLASWDATTTSGRCAPCVYDLDETFGIIFGGNALTPATDPVAMGLVSTKYPDGLGPYPYLYQEFLPEIKARYADLRTSGVLQPETLLHLISETTDLLDPDIFAQEISLWGTNDQASISYVLDWFVRRLSWLDTQWGYSA